MKSAASLDHIIILVPASFLTSPPAELSSQYTITPGGTHADGKTSNNLIVFRDGSYIELIAFNEPEAETRKDHWWGDKDYGVIDWALTTDQAGDADGIPAAVEERLGKVGKGVTDKYAYNKPVDGGRKRPNGTEIKWRVTFPRTDGGLKRGDIPFWCHDVTDRKLRAPVDDEKAITHPCGAIGIQKLCIAGPEARAKELQEVYTAISGSSTGHMIAEDMRLPWVHKTGKISDEECDVMITPDPLKTYSDGENLAVSAIYTRIGRAKCEMAEFPTLDFPRRSSRLQQAS